MVPLAYESPTFSSTSKRRHSPLRQRPPISHISTSPNPLMLSHSSSDRSTHKSSHRLTKEEEILLSSVDGALFSDVALNFSTEDLDTSAQILTDLTKSLIPLNDHDPVPSSVLNSLSQVEDFFSDCVANLNKLEDSLLVAKKFEYELDLEIASFLD
ncbi:hypothetical protein RCL1_001826 [Eukaryota sp. TZLM3-RCL]